MKCPSCGYNTFDKYERCKRCGALFAGGRWKSRLKSIVGSDKDLDRIQDTETKKLFEEHPDEVKNVNKDPFVDENKGGSEIEDDYNSISRPAVDDIISDSGNKAESEEDFLTLASFTRRFLSFLTDLVVIIIISFITLVFGLYAAGYDPVKGIINLSYIIIPVYIILTLLASTYLLFLHAYSGKTVGKLIFGIRVVKEDGSGISLADSFVRWIGYYISTLPLFYGFFSALFDLHYQTWHDKLSRSYVIKDR